MFSHFVHQALQYMFRILDVQVFITVEQFVGLALFIVASSYLHPYAIFCQLYSRFPISRFSIQCGPVRFNVCQLKD